MVSNFNALVHSNPTPIQPVLHMLDGAVRNIKTMAILAAIGIITHAFSDKNKQFFTSSSCP